MKKKMKLDMCDVALLGGAGMVAVGIWQIYPPAALIVTGIGIGWWSINEARRRSRSRSR